MATFEEDLEHVNGNSMMEFIDRMDKRAACETDSEDEDVNRLLQLAQLLTPSLSLRMTVQLALMMPPQGSNHRSQA